MQISSWVCVTTKDCFGCTIRREFTHSHYLSLLQVGMMNASQDISNRFFLVEIWQLENIVLQTMTSPFNICAVFIINYNLYHVVQELHKSCSVGQIHCIWLFCKNSTSVIKCKFTVWLHLLCGVKFAVWWTFCTETSLTTIGTSLLQRSNLLCGNLFCTWVDITC